MAVLVSWGSAPLDSTGPAWSPALRQEATQAPGTAGAAAANVAQHFVKLTWEIFAEWGCGAARYPHLGARGPASVPQAEGEQEQGAKAEAGDFEQLQADHDALQSLPESFGQLDEQPDALQSLPESFGRLHAQPDALQSLPESFGQLED